MKAIPLGLMAYLFFVVSHVARIILDICAVILSPIIFIVYNSKANIIKTKQYKTIFITGGSSGIGRQIGYEFAMLYNNCNIIITGTNKDRLNEAEQYIKNIKTFKGNVISKLLNVCDAKEMSDFIKKMDKEYTIDLVIANAGVGGGMGTGNVQHYQDNVKALIDVNITGVMNTILPIIPHFQDRKRGHIAVTGSLAGWISCAGSTYGGTKAYARFVCDDLRAKLAIWNINVSYIGPSWVDSRMCPKSINGKKPFFLSTDKAAKIIVTGLINHKHSINFPLQMFSFVWVLGTLHPILQKLIYDPMQNKDAAILQIGRQEQATDDDDDIHWH